MALQKQIELDTGQIVEYWMITGYKDNKKNKTFSITVTPYITQDLRDADKLPVSDGVRIIVAKDEPLFNKTTYTDYFAPATLDRFAKEEGLSLYGVMYKFLREVSTKSIDLTGATDC